MIIQIQGQDISQRYLEEEIVIDNQSEISFSQNEKQKIFVYGVKYKEYIQIKINIKQQYFIDGYFRIQICSSLNKIPRILEGISSNMLQIEADLCDQLNYQLQSSDNFLSYQPDGIKEGDKIYIGVFMSQIQQSIIYNLSILKSDYQICPMRCSMRGSCLINSKCQCENSYIKDDCSIQANELKLDELWKGFIVKGQIQYFIINFQDSTYQNLSQVISIVFEKKVDKSNELLENSSQNLNAQLSIYYLFKEPNSEVLPTNLLTKSVLYMNQDNMNLDFTKEQISFQSNKQLLVLAIYSSVFLKQELSVIITSYEPQADDSLKNKIFIFFFGGLGLLFIIWIAVLAYRACKRRLIDSIREQQAQLQISPNRRTQRVQPSKLTLSLDIINKFMPIRKYSEIQSLFKKSNKGLAIYCLITSILQKEQKQNKNDEIFLKKQISNHTMLQSQIQVQTIQNVRLSTVTFSQNNQNATRSNLNDSQPIFHYTSEPMNIQNLQDQNISISYQDAIDHRSNNFDNSIQILRGNNESFVNKEEIDEEVEDKVRSNEIEDNIEQENEKGNVENEKDNVKNEEKHEESCLVCLLEFEQDSQIIIAICDHIFHSECILQWFQSQENCPTCRRDLQRRKLRNWFGQKVKKQLKIFRNEKNQQTIQSYIKSTFPQFYPNFIEDQQKNNCEQSVLNSPSRKRSPYFKCRRKPMRFSINGQNQQELNQQSQVLENLQNIQYNNNNIEENQQQNIQNNEQNFDDSANFNFIEFNGAISRILPIQIKQIQQKDSNSKVDKIQVMEEDNEDEEDKKEQEDQKEMQTVQQKQNGNEEMNQQHSEFRQNKFKNQIKESNKFEKGNYENNMINSEVIVIPIQKNDSFLQDNKQKLLNQNSKQNNNDQIQNRDNNYIQESKQNKDENKQNNLKTESQEKSNLKQNDDQQIDDKYVFHTNIYTHLNKLNKSNQSQIQNISSHNINNLTKLNQQKLPEELDKEKFQEQLLKQEQYENIFNIQISLNESQNNSSLQKQLKTTNDNDQDNDIVINNTLNENQVKKNKIKSQINTLNNSFEVKQNILINNSGLSLNQQLNENNNLLSNITQANNLSHDSNKIQQNDNNIQQSININLKNKHDNQKEQDQAQQLLDNKINIQDIVDFSLVKDEQLQNSFKKSTTLNTYQHIKDEASQLKLNKEIKIRSITPNGLENIKTTQITLLSQEKSVNKQENDNLNIEIIQNHEFSPTQFCIKPNEMFKSVNNNQNKEKSQTAMRNNKKIIIQDQKQNNNIRVNEKISPIKKGIQNKLQEISLIYQKSDKKQQKPINQLNSTPLINNANNILNNKKIKLNMNQNQNQTNSVSKNIFENKSSIILQSNQNQNNPQQNKTQIGNLNIQVENLDI